VETNNAIAGLSVVLDVLIKHLAATDAIDFRRFLADLKNQYNSLSERHADSEGAQVLHTVISHLEREPEK
jgi:hypothetical protein